LAGMGCARRSRKRDLEILVTACLVVILSYALRVQGDRVVIWFLPRWPLPQVCGARAWLGITCPFCGLTRSFIYLAHGQWEAAWRCHRLGWLLAGLTAAQIPYRLLALGRGPLLTRFEARVILGVAVFMLIFNWAIEQVFRI